MTASGSDFSPSASPTPAQRRVWDALTNLECRPHGRPDRQYMALCPAHADRSPSLSVGYGYQDGVGRVLLTCHAGCDRDAVLAVLGVAWEDTFDGDRANFKSRATSRVADNPNVSDIPTSTVEATAPASATAPAPAPVQVPINTGDSPTSLLERFQAVKSGSVDPEWSIRLRFDLLPPNARTMRSGLENVGILMALQLEDGDTRPCEVSCSVYARTMGWSDPDGDDNRRASRHLREFVRLGCLRDVGSLQPINGRSRGTKLYQPGDYDLAHVYDGVAQQGAVYPLQTDAVGVESAAPTVDVGGGLIEPAVEPDNGFVVERTDGARADDGREVASGDSALTIADDAAGDANQGFRAHATDSITDTDPEVPF